MPDGQGCEERGASSPHFPFIEEDKRGFMERQEDSERQGRDKSEQVPASSKDETICRVLSSFSSPSVQTFDIQSGIRVILKVKAICLLAQLAHD